MRERCADMVAYNSSRTMKAMILKQTCSLESCQAPLELVELPRPEPAAGDLLLRVLACGVCHTELDEIEGRTAPPQLPVVLGHEVVAIVEGAGTTVNHRLVGQRVGVGWIHHSSGDDDENLSPDFCATGRDVNGGYAEYMTVPADYAYPIPDQFSDAEAAPLLCAGAIGYRALRLAAITNGQRLGLTGFGASAHLMLQLSRHLYPDTPVYVFARDDQSRAFARELGAAWAGATDDRAPESLHAIIDTTPAWMPVVEAMANIRPGGRLVINAIRKEDGDKQQLMRLSYHDHVWMEREIKTVANITRRDIAEFLPVAAEIPIVPSVTTYPLEEAYAALLDLRKGGGRGAKVLTLGG